MSDGTFQNITLSVDRPNSKANDGGANGNANPPEDSALPVDSLESDPEPSSVPDDEAGQVDGPEPNQSGEDGREYKGS